MEDLSEKYTAEYNTAAPQTEDNTEAVIGLSHDMALLYEGDEKIGLEFNWCAASESTAAPDQSCTDCPPRPRLGPRPSPPLEPVIRPAESPTEPSPLDLTENSSVNASFDSLKSSHDVWTQDGQCGLSFEVEDTVASVKECEKHQKRAQPVHVKTRVLRAHVRPQQMKLDDCNKIPSSYACNAVADSAAAGQSSLQVRNTCDIPEPPGSTFFNLEQIHPYLPIYTLPGFYPGRAVRVIHHSPPFGPSGAYVSGGRVCGYFLPLDVTQHVSPEDEEIEHQMVGWHPLSMWYQSFE